MQAKHGNGAIVQAALAGGTASTAAEQNDHGRLPSGVLSAMEAAFGRSFSDVRVSEGERVRPGQLALTEGRNVDFAPGQFKPESSAGRFLLAHELTHVVQQQNGGGAAALAKSSGSSAPARPDLEREANNVAARVAGGGGGPVQVLGRVSPGESVTLAFDAREHVLAAWKANKSWVQMGDFFLPWAFTVPMADLFESVDQARKIAEKDPDQFEAVLALQVAQPIIHPPVPGEKEKAHVTREEPGAEPGFTAAGAPTGEIYSPVLDESRTKIDELLKIAAVDPGQFRGHSPQSGRRKTRKDYSKKIMETITQRFYKLASENVPHYMNPERGDLNLTVKQKIDKGSVTNKKGKELHPNLAATYRKHHERALRQAVQDGQTQAGIGAALTIEGWAAHFLTDCFAGGHLRTVRHSAAEHWDQRAPQFYKNMLGYLAERMFDKLSEPNPKAERHWKIRAVQWLRRHGPWLGFTIVHSTVKGKLKSFPEIGGGPALGALPQHDYDNYRGVWATVNGKEMRLMGDGWVDQATMTVAAEAAELSVNEVYRAYQMGTQRKSFEDVASAFKKDDLYAAEHSIPSRIKPDEELAPADRSLPWDNVSINAMFEDENFQKGLARFLMNKRGDFSDVTDTMEDYEREALEKTVLKDMTDDPVGVVKDIFYWKRDKQERAINVLSDAARDGALRSLSRSERLRLTKDLLSGRLTKEQAHLLRSLLLTAPASEVRQIIKDFGEGRLRAALGPKFSELVSELPAP